MSTNTNSGTTNVFILMIEFLVKEVYLYIFIVYSHSGGNILRLRKLIRPR